jgi:hypothetical protein
LVAWKVEMKAAKSVGKMVEQLVEMSVDLMAGE